MNKETITVNIKYQETEQTFIGDPDQVWITINKFFSEMIPALQTIKKITLTIDIESLITDREKIIAIAPEGTAILISKQELTDTEKLILQLLAAYIGGKLGKTKGFLTQKELQVGLEKSPKITSTRLGELIREGLAAKTKEGNYIITTFGIKRFQEKRLPEIQKKATKIKAKL